MPASDVTLAPVPTVTPDQIELIKQTVAQGASNANLQLYLYDCARRGVHPLDRQIHFSQRNGRYTPLVSIDFLRSRAAMTGEMAGSDDAAYRVNPDDLGVPLSATVTVYRLTNGQRYAYSATARFEEYKAEPGPNNRGDAMWRTKPFLMIGKCAEALALRKAFPQDLSGLYTPEEMDADLASPPTAETTTETTTGADRPSSTRNAGLPPPPKGYRYIDAFHEEGGWAHVLFYDPTRQRPARHYKTQVPKLGKMLRDAYDKRQPVALDVSLNPKHGEPGFVNAVDVLPQPVDLDAAEATRDIHDDPPA